MSECFIHFADYFAGGCQEGLHGRPVAMSSCEVSSVKGEELKTLVTIPGS